MAKDLHIKDSGGTVREVSELYVKDSGGVVRTITEGYIKDSGGVIRQFWPAVLQPPVNIVIPTISGDTEAGSTLTVTDDGTWTGSVPITFTYQWTFNTVPIGGETNSTYVTTAGDVGDSIQCLVTGTNADGFSGAFSNVITPTAAGQLNPSMGNMTDAATYISGPSVTSRLTVNTDGTTDALTFGTEPDWFIPSGTADGSLYEVFLTEDSSTTSLSGGAALDTWLPLSSARFWQITGTTAATWSGTISFREIATPANTISTNFHLEIAV